MNKKSWMVGGVILFALTISLSNAYAHHEGYDHGACGGGFESMFFKKSHFILEKKQDLGLAEDKVEAIKNLNLETKKMLIKQDAEIQILSLDIMAKLHDYPVNTETVNKWVDQQYELKKTQAQSLVEAIAKFKGTLSKDQYDILHKLWEESEKDEHRESH